MYAIIETGGKQYRVSVGQNIEVEKLPVSVGQTVEIDDVLLLADDGEFVVGKPTVTGARVRATVVEQGRGRKIIVFKFKSGNRYHRKRGHRQSYTRLRIEEILHGDVKEERPVEEAVAEEPKVSTAEESVERVPVSIDELGLPARIAGLLKGAGIEGVEDLLRKDEEELLDIRGFGAKSLDQVRASLKAKGFIKGQSGRS
jgi:large subunit ribosomal protein L21